MYATRESSGFHWRNSPELCCGTYMNVVPTLNSEGEGSETQRCPRFSEIRTVRADGGIFLTQITI